MQLSNPKENLMILEMEVIITDSFGKERLIYFSHKFKVETAAEYPHPCGKAVFEAFCEYLTEDMRENHSDEINVMTYASNPKFKNHFFDESACSSPTFSDLGDFREKIDGSIHSALSQAFHWIANNMKQAGIKNPPIITKEMRITEKHLEILEEALGDLQVDENIVKSSVIESVCESYEIENLGLISEEDYEKLREEYKERFEYVNER